MELEKIRSHFEIEQTQVSALAETSTILRRAVGLPCTAGARALVLVELRDTALHLEGIAVDLIDAVGVNSRGRVKSPRSPMEIHFTVARLVALHQLADVFDELHVEAILHIDLVG